LRKAASTKAGVIEPFFPHSQFSPRKNGWQVVVKFNRAIKLNIQPIFRGELLCSHSFGGGGGSYYITMTINVDGFTSQVACTWMIQIFDFEWAFPKAKNRASNGTLYDTPPRFVKWVPLKNSNRCPCFVFYMYYVMASEKFCSWVSVCPSPDGFQMIPLERVEGFSTFV
jgi:hypothetical protein